MEEKLWKSTGVPLLFVKGHVLYFTLLITSFLMKKNG